MCKHTAKSLYLCRVQAHGKDIRVAHLAAANARQSGSIFAVCWIAGTRQRANPKSTNPARFGEKSPNRTVSTARVLFPAAVVARRRRRPPPTNTAADEHRHRGPSCCPRFLPVSASPWPWLVWPSPPAAPPASPWPEPSPPRRHHQHRLAVTTSPSPPATPPRRPLRSRHHLAVPSGHSTSPPRRGHLPVAAPHLLHIATSGSSPPRLPVLLRRLQGRGD